MVAGYNQTIRFNETKFDNPVRYFIVLCLIGKQN